MRLLDWKQEYCLGIDAVDHDHRDLIETINRLHEAYDDPIHPHDAATVLRAVITVVGEHFAEEETVMRARAYAGLAAHKQDHDLLLDALRDLAEAFEGADELDSVELALRLEPWFARHFHSYDARMIEALREH